MRISPEEAARTKEALAVLESCGIDRMDMPELGVAYRQDGQGELVEEGMEASPCEHVDPDGSVTAAVFDGRDMPSTDCVDVIGETPDMSPLDTDRILAMLEESDRPPFAKRTTLPDGVTLDDGQDSVSDEGFGALDRLLADIMENLDEPPSSDKSGGGDDGR